MVCTRQNRYQNDEQRWDDVKKIISEIYVGKNDKIFDRRMRPVDKENLDNDSQFK